MDQTTLASEIKRVQDILSAAKPGSEDYAHYLQDLENLEKLRETSQESDFNLEKQERELKLAEKKQRMDAALKEDEIKEKRKDSKRGVAKVIIAGSLAIGQLIIAGLFDERKVIARQLLSYVRKTPDSKL